MTDVTLRATKGSPLTHAELDDNMISTKSGRKNLIIGGNFDTNPFISDDDSNVGNGSYKADMFSWQKVGVGRVTMDKAVQAPTQAEANTATTNSLKLKVDIIDASITSTDQYGMAHKIEGYTYHPISEKPMVLTFWHRFTKTGTYCVSLANDPETQVVVFEYTQTTTDTWEKETIKIPAAPSTGFLFTDGVGIRIDWSLALGTDFHTSTTGSWVSETGVRGTSNQVNGMDSTLNEFYFGLIQLEQGIEETDFEVRTQSEELALVNRYVEMSYDLGTEVKTVTQVGSLQTSATGPFAGDAVETVQFKVEKRGIPTIETFNPIGGANVSWRSVDESTNINAQAQDIGQSNCTLIGNSAMINTARLVIHWRADAQL